MRVEIGAKLQADGFDPDHLPVLLWTRELVGVPRVGDEVNNTHQATGVHVVMTVTGVTWLDEGERDHWDVAIFGNVTEAYDDADLSLEEFAERLGIPRIAS